MSDLKTKPTSVSVEDFINNLESEQKKTDSFTILKMMESITKEKAKMWGDSIIGFGDYHYKYESGREGDWFITGFSPRKQNLSLYIMSGFNRYKELLENLGKYKTGASCLYINKLSDVDMEVLQELIQGSVDYMNKKYNE